VLFIGEVVASIKQKLVLTVWYWLIVILEPIGSVVKILDLMNKLVEPTSSTKKDVLFSGFTEFNTLI
jgi:hypothetical protein